MQRYETFEHEADIGIRGFGDTPEQAFAHAAEAMFSVMVDISTVAQLDQRTVRVSAGDQEQLLIEWLNSLLTISDLERLVFSRFEVHIEGAELRGDAWGEPFDRSKHEPKVEVKGATYHMLSLRPFEGGYVAECVVDV